MLWLGGMMTLTGLIDTENSYITGAWLCRARSSELEVICGSDWL